MICYRWLVRALVRSLFSILLVFFVVLTASAYTIVMREGRRVEVGSVLAVTPTSLTYEVSPGIQVTLQLAAVDIAATERINREPSGSFLRHYSVQVKAAETRANSLAEANSSARRTITNRDLENFRLARIESERAYELRRKELGLPAVEETRRRVALDGDASLERLRQLGYQKQATEDYWRNRASLLRAELAATNARIDFLRGRLDVLPLPFSSGAFVNGFPFATFGGLTWGQGLQTNALARPKFLVAPAAGSQFAARVGFGNRLGTRQTLVNPAPFRRVRNFDRPLTPFPAAGILSLPFQSDAFALQSSALITQLDEMLAYRAGLEARWRSLEEDARRAGASPGWLRE